MVQFWLSKYVADALVVLPFIVVGSVLLWSVRLFNHLKRGSSGIAWQEWLFVAGTTLGPAALWVLLLKWSF